MSQRAVAGKDLEKFARERFRPQLRPGVGNHLPELLELAGDVDVRERPPASLTIDALCLSGVDIWSIAAMMLLIFATPTERLTFTPLMSSVARVWTSGSKYLGSFWIAVRSAFSVSLFWATDEPQPISEPSACQNPVLTIYAGPCPASEIASEPVCA